MLKKTVIFVVLILFAIQLIGIDKTTPPRDETLTLNATPEVMTLLKKSCYDCHSFETNWPYYSSVAPISFFVAGHIKDARKAMNFSLWNSMDEKIKRQRLKRAIVTVNNERMALPSYVLAHEEAKLTQEEKKTLTNWFEDELEILSQKNSGKQ